MLLPWAHGLGTECPAVYLEDLFSARARDFQYGTSVSPGRGENGPRTLQGSLRQEGPAAPSGISQLSAPSPPPALRKLWDRQSEGWGHTPAF